MAKGFIRDKNDIKFLLLFLLDSTGNPLSRDILLEAAMADEGVDYFAYTEALTELADGGFLTVGEKIAITADGRRNFRALGKILSYSVRRKAQDAVMRAISRANRAKCIEAHTEKVRDNEENHFVTTLAMTDGKDDIVRMQLMTVSHEQAAALETNFRRNAEAVYNGILDVLTKEYDSPTQE